MFGASLNRFFSFIPVSAAAMSLTVVSASAVAEQDQMLMAALGISISTEDFNRYVEFMVPADRRDSALAQENAVKQSIESMYIVRFLADEARENPDGIDFEAAEWQADYHRDRLIMNKYLELRLARDLEGLDFGDVALEEYRAYPERYTTQERRRAAHILISNSGRTDEEALARAQEAYEKLQDGAEFGSVVADYSDDPSAVNNGGALSFFTRGQMVPGFEAAAFSMGEGEMSEPVKTRYGYHIIRMDEIQPEQLREFETVKAGIESRLRGERTKQLRAGYIEEVKANAQANGLIVNMEAVQSLEEKYGAPKPSVMPTP